MSERKVKYPPIYYWNMYAPHNWVRRHLGYVLYDWADGKYGTKARGPFSVALTVKQREMLEKWHYWMDIKNKYFHLL